MNLLGQALSNCTIKDSKITFGHSYTEDEIWELYDKFNEALFECKIPFSKPIGFIINMVSFKMTSPISNTPVLGMSPVEFGYNLNKIGFASTGGTVWSETAEGTLATEDYIVPEDKKMNGKWVAYTEKIIRPKYEGVKAKLSYLICRPFNKMFLISPDARPYIEEIKEMQKKGLGNDSQELRDLALETIKACDVEPRNVMYFTRDCRTSVREKEKDRPVDFVSDFHVSTVKFSNDTDRSGTAYVGIVCLEGVGKRSITDNQDIINISSGKAFAVNTVYDLSDYFTICYPKIGSNQVMNDGFKLNIEQGVNTEVLENILRRYGRSL